MVEVLGQRSLNASVPVHLPQDSRRFGDSSIVRFLEMKLIHRASCILMMGQLPLWTGEAIIELDTFTSDSICINIPTCYF